MRPPESQGELSRASRFFDQRATTSSARSISSRPTGQLPAGLTTDPVGQVPRSGTPVACAATTPSVVLRPCITGLPHGYLGAPELQNTTRSDSILQSARSDEDPG